MEPCVVVQEFVPVPLPSGALEQGLCDPVYHRRGGNGKGTMRTRAMCQEFVPGPSPKWCSKQGPRVPVYHYCGSELEGVASDSVVQKLVSAPFSSGALEQPRYGSVYHRL